MANPSKAKGTRVENEIVARLQEAGIDAERMPGSGMFKGYEHDVVVRVAGQELRAEVKARKNGEGFATLEGWLGKAKLLFLKRDRAQPFVVMSFDTLVALLRPVEVSA